MVDLQPLGAQETPGGESAQPQSSGIGPRNTQRCATFMLINNLTTTSPLLSSATEFRSWQRHKAPLGEAVSRDLRMGVTHLPLVSQWG